jgi:hypothetical protein
LLFGSYQIYRGFEGEPHPYIFGAEYMCLHVLGGHMRGVVDKVAVIYGASEAFRPHCRHGCRLTCVWAWHIRSRDYPAASHPQDLTDLGGHSSLPSLPRGLGSRLQPRINRERDILGFMTYDGQHHNSAVYCIRCNRKSWPRVMSTRDMNLRSAFRATSSSRGPILKPLQLIPDIPWCCRGRWPPAFPEI